MGYLTQLMPKLPKFLQQLANVDTAITTLLLTNLISVAAFLLLFKLYCQPNQIGWSQASEVLKNLAEVIAIVIAGVWTYYLFIRGRVLKERLELKISGRCAVIEGRQFLITTGKIANVGTSNFTIMDGGAFIRIAAYPAPNERGIHTPKEINSGSFAIFPKDRLLEPGESISNERITSIDHQFAAIGIEMFIYSAERTWYTSCVVEKCLESEQNGVQQPKQN